MTLNAFMEAVADIENRLRGQPDEPIPVHELDQASHAAKLAKAEYFATVRTVAPGSVTSAGPVTLRGEAIAKACVTAPGMHGCSHWLSAPLQPFTVNMDRRIVCCSECRPIVDRMRPSLYSRCSFCLREIDHGEPVFRILTRVALATIDGSACDDCRGVFSQLGGSNV